ncbi:LysR family transcriptional regulator [Acetobacter okinawensis]|uniref:LysR family transcriptional regulator n=1 Tax=Acetobacter okinawensis TaxID=1076594 RepID=UPI0039E79911
MSLETIDLNLLVAFEALMAERNVTRAGARIGRSQPAMSAALARLRELMEDELFVRGPGGLQPTSRALELIGPIGEALAAIRRSLPVSQGFDPLTTVAALTIGMTDFPASMLLQRIVAALRQRAPGMVLQFRTFIGRNDATALLDAGEVDITIGVPPDPVARILSRPLFFETFGCLLRRDHPAAGHLDIETFAALPHLLVSPENERYGFVDAALARLGLKRHIALTVPQLFAVPDVIAASDLIATVPRGAFRSRNAALRMLTPPLELDPLPFVLCWHRRNDSHLMQEWARNCIVEITSGAH